jgi:hypothetical protein
MQPLNFSRTLEAEEEEFKRLLYVPTGERDAGRTGPLLLVVRVTVLLR